jgi:diguanylate cyclase (GGDEF)-like protein
MNCDRALELISARIDSEILFEDQALNAHLEGCAGCRLEMDGLRRLDEFLVRSYAPEREAAEVLVDKVKATLQAHGRPVRRCTVLVVDDHPETLLFLRAFLSEEFEVETARGGRDAQEWFGRRAFDILLTDQRMPGMPGVSLLEWAVQHHPRTKRIMMTGLGNLEEAVEAINRGHVFRYLLKPFGNNELLLTALRAAAHQLQLERDYERVLAQLSELNVQLEERVRQRTQALVEANRELEQKTQTLEKFALTDVLTQLPNRRALDHLLERELHLRRRFPAALTVGLIDLDFFKDVNTRYLHSGGDFALRELARVLTAGLRKIDMLGRMAGDEFLLIAPQTHRAGGLALAERLRAQVEAHPFVYDGQQIPVTVTIGLAVVEAGRPAEYEQVRKAAETALARAKAHGRNCVEIEPVSPPAKAPPAETPPGEGEATSA